MRTPRRWPRSSPSLWVFWWLDSYLEEGRALVERVLARREELSAPALSRALAARSAVAFLQADYEQAVADATAALDESRDVPEAGYCLAILGLIQMFATAGEAGEEELRSAIHTLDAVGDRWGAAASETSCTSPCFSTTRSSTRTRSTAW